MPAPQSGLMLCASFGLPGLPQEHLFLSTMTNPGRPFHHMQTSILRNNATVSLIKKKAPAILWAPPPFCWISLGHLLVVFGGFPFHHSSHLGNTGGSPHSVPVLSSMLCRSSGSAKIIASMCVCNFSTVPGFTGRCS